MASCGLLEGDACTSELLISVDPTSANIETGEAFTPRVDLSTCSGREAVSDQITWSVASEEVLEVDRITGRAVGRAPGTTELYATGDTHGRLATIPVVVR